MTVSPDPTTSTDPPHPRAPQTRFRRRPTWRLLLAGVGLGLLLAAPAVWIRVDAAGHLHSSDDGPDAPVVIVFGAQLAPGGTRPMPFLKGRLDMATQLVREGSARAVLVSGDQAGASGDEIAAMSAYLVAAGVPADHIVGDPYGLDSYDTCRRAHDVYGVRRALLVSQSLHLPRAVAICRRLGIDAEGVAAHCDGCQTVTLAMNTAREIPAAWKAAYDLAVARPPAVSSAPDPTLQHILGD